MEHRFLQSSRDPLGAINAASYLGQLSNLRKYKEGYEGYFDDLPVLDYEDRLVNEKFEYSANVLHQLALRLSGEQWITEDNVPHGQFERTILAISEKIMDRGVLKNGPEVIVAEWGKGYRSPVHGHSTGLLYEELIKGKFLVNTYRIIDLKHRIVRLAESKIYEGNKQVLSLFTPHKEQDDQSIYVHSFIALEASKSLHYIPGHSPDGMGNSFDVEEFRGVNSGNTKHIKRSQIEKGDVILARCLAGRDYMDHFIYITGDNEENICLTAGKWDTSLLDIYGDENEDVFLALNDRVKKAFIEFHGLPVIEPIERVFDMPFII